MYALVLWNDPDPTPCNCIDINKIPSRSMLEDPAICCLIPVHVYEMKGYSDTEVVREYYGRVLQTGSKFILKFFSSTFLYTFIHIER